MSSVTAASSPFLGGETPNAADATLAPALLVAHNVLLSGLASIDVSSDTSSDTSSSSPPSLASLGGPSLLPYLERWSTRRSWTDAYRRGGVVNAAVVRHLAASILERGGGGGGGGGRANANRAAAAAELAACVERARGKDTAYADAVRARGGGGGDGGGRANANRAAAAAELAACVERARGKDTAYADAVRARGGGGGGGAGEGSDDAPRKLKREKSAKRPKRDKSKKTNAVICI
jgi:hypothetical protein